MIRPPLIALLSVVACVALAPPRQAAQPTARRTEMVAMTDGKRLATDCYVPSGTGPFPTVLVRTPYNKNTMEGVGGDAVRRGYAMVIQDTRGRFASEGENLPFIGDGWAGHRDGYDTLEWIARQPWCSGKIGTMGGSALGITQLFEAGTGTTRLAAQNIQVAAPSYYEPLTHRGGVLRKAMIEDWIAATKHDPASVALFEDRPSYDAWWRDRDLTRRWSFVDAPAVHVGGWYDIFTQGVIDSYEGYQAHGGPHARGQQKLVMGPWTHGIFQDRAGALTFPNGAQPPGGIADPWRWFDHYLKGEDNGIDRLPAVTYYLMGDSTGPGAPGNVWRTADRWPPPSRSAQLYLNADRSASFKPHTAGEPLTYTYDPHDPAPTVGGPQLTLPPGPMDQRTIERRPDVLVFTGTALTTPLEVTGRLRASIWASSDAPDTDWVVKLCDVYPDGRSLNVCEGILRARFRHSFSRPEPLTPGSVERYDIDLWSTSIVFGPGHRLRVLVTSSSAPGYEANPNTGKPAPGGSAARVAHNAIYTDAHHRSCVMLPVVQGM